MGSMTRAIRRNIVANQAAKEGFKRADFFAWRRQYIKQLEATIDNPKSSKKEIKEAKEALKGLRF